MGAESFNVLLQGSNADVGQVIGYIENLTDIHPDHSPWQLLDDRLFLYKDGRHIIEMLVDRPESESSIVRVSCRFALCHPNSIDDVFTSFVKTLATNLEMTIEIMESVPESNERIVFKPPLYERFETLVKKGIEIKRNYWTQDFGHETASLSCSEALRKYMGKYQMNCKCNEIEELEGVDAQQYCKAHLQKIKADNDKWQIEYVCPITGKHWLLDYPHSEYHGGGSPRLRRLTQEKEDP